VVALRTNNWYNKLYGWIRFDGYGAGGEIKPEAHTLTKAIQINLLIEKPGSHKRDELWS
jgi:hypothetical protein